MVIRSHILSALTFLVAIFGACICFIGVGQVQSIFAEFVLICAGVGLWVTSVVVFAKALNGLDR